MARPKTRHIGTDRVVLQDDRLLVVSHVDMESWSVRRHRPTLIRFDGRTWRVADKTTGADKTIQYDLVPWTAVEEQLTGPEIDYDAGYVALRDQAIILGRRRGYATALLGIVSPFIGFFPARTKAWLEHRYGIDPVASTFHSVFLEFLVTLAGLALASIGMGAWIMGASPAATGLPVDLFLVIAVIAGVDGAVRYGRILAEERPPPGFYEWAIRRRIN